MRMSLIICKKTKQTNNEQNKATVLSVHSSISVLSLSSRDNKCAFVPIPVLEHQGKTINYLIDMAVLNKKAEPMHTLVRILQGWTGYTNIHQTHTSTVPGYRAQNKMYSKN